MQIRVQSLSFRLTEPIRQHVEGRVGPALIIVGEQTGTAVVRLSDLNGPRGGADKCCRILVWLRTVGSIAVEAVHDDLYLAVDRAAAKLRTVISRRAGRRRTLLRKDKRKRLPSADPARTTFFGAPARRGG